MNAEKFMNVVRRHTSFEELTPTLPREFVEKIVVHECGYDENNTRRQDIEIYYSFCWQGGLARITARPIRHNAQVIDFYIPDVKLAIQVSPLCKKFSPSFYHLHFVCLFLKSYPRGNTPSNLCNPMIQHVLFHQSAMIF